MKLSLLAILCFFCLNTFSQTAKKLNSPQAINIVEDIVYANASDWKSEKQDLKMDVLTPASDKELPLVVFIHGGGFYGGDKKTHTAFCTSLSEQGYVVANINYRLGFDTSAGQKDISIIMACYRAAQDASSALRYLMHHAKDYHIDTTAVFLSGESAGGVTSLADAYMSQQQWDALFPFIHQNLGPIEGSGNELKASYQLRGIISMWGGILDTALISSSISKQIPVALIQSQSDEVIPYQHSKGQRTLFNTLYGSFDIAQRFLSNGSCARLYYTKEAKHFSGFSHHYVVAAMKSFIDDVLNGKCSSLIKENTGERNDLPFSNYQ